MTRINVIPIIELSDQHLRAEYMGLPRALKGNWNIKDAPLKYTLNKGHVKWAKKFDRFTLLRYFELCNEMDYRGFKRNYSASDLQSKIDLKGKFYLVTEEDRIVNRNRIIERIQLKPNWYNWTKREIPLYAKELRGCGV